jgi:PKD repeat protein
VQWGVGRLALFGRGVGVLLTIQLALCGGVQSASAAEVTLAWEPVEAAQPIAYELHYGRPGGPFDQVLKTTSTTLTVPDLTPGASYCFAVRACPPDESVCSEFSNEVCAAVPEPTLVEPDPPTAAFTVDRTFGRAPLTVSFTDASSGEVTGLEWTLGDGGTSTAARVIHTYVDPGIYTVALTASGPGGSDREVKPDLVKVFSTTLRRSDDDDPELFETAGTDTLMTDAEAPVMEAGEVLIDHQWRRVDFQQSFSDPIVVARSLSHNDGDPAIVRIRDVDAEGFWIRIQEWDYLDGLHADETVGYLAVERGHHQLADGTRVEADVVETGGNGRFQWSAFEARFPVPPVVVTAVTSANESDAVISRVRQIDTTGFELQLREQEAFDQLHAIENVDYVAWEPSAGVVDGLRYEVGRTPDAVTHRPHGLLFESGFEAPPMFVAGMQTTDGGDTAVLRWQGMTDAGADVWVEEEQSQDTETRHAMEAVGYFAFERATVQP